MLCLAGFCYGLLNMMVEKCASDDGAMGPYTFPTNPRPPV